MKTEKLIFDIETQPTLELNEATDGVPFAGYGKVEAPDGKTLISPFTKTACVYYHSIKEIYIRSGKHGSWKIIGNMVNFIPFYLTDGKGKLTVDVTNLDEDFSGYKLPMPRLIPDPKYSEIDCIPILKKQESSEIKEKAVLGIFDSESEIRLTEYILIPGVKVFAYGMVTDRGKGLVLHEDQRNPLIISSKTKERFIEEFYKGGNLTYLVHFLVALGFTITILSLNYLLNLNSIIFLNILLIGNSIITGSIVFSVFNRMITLKQRALTAQSNIDIELKRRTDLIPGIVALVKEYAKYEAETQQIITESRQHLGVIPSLVAVIENYPKLKANENFKQLMTSLIDTEERIAYSREFYNRNIRKYNTMIAQFPFSIIAFFTGLKEMDFLRFN